MAWYSTGEQGTEKIDREVERQEDARKDRAKAYVKRWWMPPTPSKEDGPTLVFVDDAKHPQGFDTPFVFTEHQIFLNGHWRNWFTCIEGIPHPVTGKTQKCPLCANGDRPAVVSAYTVVNETEWKDKKDVIHKDELNLLVCKTAVSRLLRKKAKKSGGSLRGRRVEVTRTSSDAPNTGDSFDIEAEMVPLGDDVLPFNYPEVFAPKTEEELKRVLSGNSSVSDQVVDADDDNIRF